jgi:hypothetical protein
VPYSFWEKLPRSSPAGAVPGDTTGVAFSKNNVLWSGDLSWTPRAGLRLWGEILVDDISFSRDYKPDMVGYQAGLETRRPVGARMLGASLEYTRVNNFTYSVWHGHDFAHEGFPLGFVQGPDVASLVGELSYEHSDALELRLRADPQRRSRTRQRSRRAVGVSTARSAPGGHRTRSPPR